MSSITKVYGNGQVALRDFTGTIGSRRATVLGRNGAGKTTLLRILSTQLKPTKGSASINGYDVISEARKVRELVCSIPQEAQTAGMASPYEHVFMYLVARGFSFSEASAAARKALKELDLGDFMDRPTDELSGGMKRKVFVAMALASNAEVIFLDEPTVGLDPISRLSVWQAIRSLDSQIILTTHYMEEAAALSDEILLVDKGRLVVKGTADELLRPLKGKVRVEGVGDIRIGGISISYVDESKASEFVGRAVIRPVGLEDVMITMGAAPEDAMPEDTGTKGGRAKWRVR